ncbi:hypothetical protein LBMAG42_37530 [Deltaproteobacteria bacterium]|nr:hypothetical protein LBMAG42_37530 [Deltaproteobacteria bacterium]
MRTLLAALLLAMFAVAPTVALAGSGSGSGDHRPSAGRAHISVDVVHATDSESGVDPRLASFASQFRVFKYKGYRLLSTQSADVAPGADHTFQIEGGRTLTVTLVAKDDTHARVRVEITGKKGKLIDTTVKINRDGSFIVAGPAYKDGILILPLEVSY